MENTQRRPLPLFVRSEDDRIVTGTAGGIATALGVEPWIARLGFILMTLGGGIGIALYIAAFVLGARRGVEARPPREVTAKHTAGLLCISFAVIVGAQSLGIGLPSGTAVPLMLLVVGLVIAWARMGTSDRELLRQNPISILQGKGNSTWRLIVGGAVLIAGVALMLANSHALASTRPVLLAVAATILGLSLVLGPSLVGLTQEATKERRERIRTEERADMSAHLHDSVLNTLALIQRSDAPPNVVTMARRQERELRAWMQGRLDGESHRLDDAIDAMVSSVESQYNVSVNAVIVGGGVHMDERVTAFVSAIQEAVVNAARHSGETEISAYIEVEPNQLTGYVRDQGPGFDRAKVDSDRRGITDSIEGRMRRAGGSAVIRSGAGEGTEIELRLPRSEQ